jgi:hypothetical protein
MMRVMPSFAFVLVSGVMALSASAADFHVAPNGDDTHAGTKERPFATLRRARDAVRTRVAAGLKADMTVEIRGGVYELGEPLGFGPEDSGTEKHRITYAARPGESVVVSGGTTISGWRRGQGEIWTAPVPGVKEGKWHFRQLWVNGRRAVRARTPNRDAKTPCWRLANARLSGDLKSHTYHFAPGQLKKWRNPSDVEAVVFGNWEITRKRFQSVAVASGTAQMAGPHAAPHRAMAPGRGRWCYIENTLEALDQPGEWYLDRRAGTLSYRPREGEDMSRARVVAPRLGRLLRIAGTPERPVRNLHFKGLHFLHTEWSPPEGGYLGIQACHHVTGKAWNKAPWGRIDAAIRCDHARNCGFQDGVIAHHGGCGIELVKGCADNLIQGNHIFDIGGNGVMLGGPKDEANVPKRNRIANNHVHACGIDYPGAVGIWVGFAREAVVAHNLVHDLPYTGISMGWQWNTKPTPCMRNTIAFNHIHDVMNRLGDGGGIYTLGRQPGTVIRGNLIHDVHRSPLAQAAPNNGMFLDQGSSEILIEKNTIYHTAGSPLRFHQATTDTIKENVLICGRNMPPFRYNRTDKNSMKYVDNIVRNASEFKGLSGGARAPGRLGNGLKCGGVGSGIDVGHSPELDPPRLTVEAWIKLATYPAGEDTRRWIANKNGNEWKQAHYGLIICGKNVGAYLNTGGGQGNCHGAQSSTGPLKLNAWHHVAMTYDGSTLKVFLDGTPVASAKVGKTRVAGRGGFAIGHRQDGHRPSYFSGVIDEVRLYRKALAPEAIKRHCAAPEKMGAEESLVRHWSFDAPAGARGPDHLTKAREQAGLESPWRERLLGKKAGDLTRRKGTAPRNSGDAP